MNSLIVGQPAPALDTNRKQKRRRKLIIAFILGVVGLVAVYVGLRILRPQDFSVDNGLGRNDGKCIIGWTNTSLTSDSATASGYIPYSRVNSRKPTNAIIRKFDLDQPVSATNFAMTEDNLKDIDVLFISDFNDFSTRSNNVAIPDAAITAIDNQFKAGLNIVGAGDNGIGTSTVAQNAAFYLINLTSRAPTIKNYLSYKDVVMATPMLTATTSNATYPFLSGLPINTSTTGLHTPGTVITTSPTVCIYSIAYAAGSAYPRTCMLSYVPPQTINATKTGYIIIDANAGVPTNTLLTKSSFWSQIPDCSANPPQTFPPEIEKTSTVSSVGSQQAQIDYTLTVKNRNTGAMSGVIVTDVLPDFVQQADIINSNPQFTSYDAATHTLLWDNLTIPANGQIQIKYSLVVKAANYGTINNVVVTCPDNNHNQKCDTDEPQTTSSNQQEVTAEAINAEKTNVVQSVDGTRAVVRYTIKVTNPNTSAMTNVVVADVLPDFVTAADITNANPAYANFDAATHTATWKIASIAANSSVNITYDLTIAASNYGTITNTANVCVDANNNSTCDSNEVSTEVGSETTLTLAPPTINKTGAVQSINNIQAVIKYTLTVGNPNASALTNVTVLDKLPDFVQESNISGASPAYTSFDPSTHTITWKGVNVPANGTTTITFNLTVPAANFGSVTNAAKDCIDINNNAVCDPGEPTNSTTTETTVTAAVSVGVTKTHAAVDTASGAQVTYTVTVTNNNSTTLTGLKIVDTLPATVQSSWVSQISNGGTLSGTTITWTNVDIAGNQSVTRTYVVTYPDANPGTYNNTVQVQDPNGASLATAQDSYTVVSSSSSSSSSVPPSSSSSSSVSSSSSSEPPVSSSSVSSSVASSSSSSVVASSSSSHTPTPSLPDTALLDDASPVLIPGVLVLLGLLAYRFNIGVSAGAWILENTGKLGSTLSDIFAPHSFETGVEKQVDRKRKHSKKK
jgi:uncharacterized repeat protein (TIGR01451 family)